VVFCIPPPLLYTCQMGRKYQGGYTLIELLTIIAIIGVLFTVIITNVRIALDKAAIASAQAEIHELRKAVEFLIDNTGQWPGHNTIGAVGMGASGNEVWDLTTPSAGLLATDGTYPNWGGPYLPTIPTDSWDNNYFFDPDYDVDPTVGVRWAAVIGSFGPNGDGQHVYDSDDIFEILK